MAIAGHGYAANETRPDQDHCRCCRANMTPARLYLISANKSRPSGQPWSDDDYDVHVGAAVARVIGRIYRAPNRAGDPWFWGLNRFPSSAANSGYAPSLDEAKARFRTRWEVLG